MAEFALHHSGAIGLVRGLNGDRLRILMYHRFPHQAGSGFDRHCAFLAENYNVVPLEEAAQRLRENEPLANMAVITIDDGYADMYEVAFPILRKHRLPATLFVTTGFIDRTSWMPGDRVRHHFARTPEKVVEVIDDRKRLHTFPTGAAHASDELRALLKRVPERTKRRILSELDGDIAVPDIAAIPPQFRPCTWDQLRELAGAGVTIGAHTVTHPILSRLETAAEAEREILVSKAEIEQKLQRPAEMFAYPNGTPEDIDRFSIGCVRANFAAAVTAIPGLNAADADLHALLRLSCDPDLSLPQLARLLAGPVRRGRTPQLAAYLA